MSKVIGKDVIIIEYSSITLQDLLVLAYFLTVKMLQADKREVYLRAKEVRWFTDCGQ